MAHHPTTRAERRNARRAAIDHGYRDLIVTHWIRPCACMEIGRGQRYCSIHNGRTRYQVLVGKLAKTRPGNWLFDMERDFYASGLLRQAFRAGGGRRSGTAKDWGGGLHGAGPFYLPAGMDEYGLDSEDEVDV